MSTAVPTWPSYALPSSDFVASIDAEGTSHAYPDGAADAYVRAEQIAKCYGTPSPITPTVSSEPKTAYAQT